MKVSAECIDMIKHHEGVRFRPYRCPALLWTTAVGHVIDPNHIKRIYNGDKIYGHLNLQKECISPEIDYYMGVCPDMYFSEHLLAYMIEGAKSIKNEYFVITPQISKLWDDTWDILVNPLYKDIPYETWFENEIFDIIHNDSNLNPDII